MGTVLGRQIIILFSFHFIFLLQRDELYSDYGFGSGLDDTASSVATTSTATTTTTTNNINSNGNVIRKGLLWQQRSGLFSRWKERYLVLTPDYLNCFRRGGAGIRSEMGAFAFKVRLAEVEGVEVVDRRGYLTVVLTVKNAEGGEGGGGQGKILLRKPEGIREWYNDIKVRLKH